MTEKTSSLSGPYYLAGHELSSPLINAAGSINGRNINRIQDEFNSLLATDIGGVTLGAFTIPENIGNGEKFGEPVFHFDPITKESNNSIGLDNIGSDGAVELSDKLTEKAHARGKILIYSGSPLGNPKYGSPIKQASELAYKFLDTNVDLVEINVSCPNIVGEGGGRKPIMGYDFQTMEELMVELKQVVGSNPRLGLKMPPYLDETKEPMIPRLANLFKTVNILGFLSTSNTIPNNIPLDGRGEPIFEHIPGHTAGLSGFSERVVKMGRQQLLHWSNEVEKGLELNIISMEGVASGKEVFYRRRIGASACAGVTFLWRTDKMKFGKPMTWGERVTEMLEGFSEAISEEESVTI